MDVVILAGGKCDPELEQLTGVSYRGDIPYEGHTMAETVLAAVSSVGEPILVGGSPGLHERQVPAGDTFIRSIRNGLEAVKTETFLLATVDLPCLTAEAVTDFVSRCDTSAGLNYPIIRAEDCEKAFPGMKRTTLKLREGEFTGGNLGLMRTNLMRSALPVLERAYSARKSPLKLAGIIGYGLLGRVIVGSLCPWTLTLGSLEKKVGRFLGVPVKAIATPYAEIGADIDNATQYLCLKNLRKSA